MPIWTKPFALIFVLACLTVIGIAPNSAFAQSSSTAVLLPGTTESLAVKTAATTAKLINIEPVNDPQTAPGQPRRIVNQHANFNESTPAVQTVVNQQTSSTMVDLPISLPQSKTIAASKTTPLPTRTNTALPMVIVRPPAEGFFEGDGVSVDVDRVDGNSPNEFSVKLRVPHSVKVIEVTPIQNGSVAQNYKIRLTQKPDGRHMTSKVAHLLKKTSGEPVSNQISPGPPQPTETRPGFQRNPFFNSDSSVPPQRIAALSKTVSQQPISAETHSVQSTVNSSENTSQRAAETVSPATSVLTSENAAELNVSQPDLNFTKYPTPTLAEPAPVTISKTNTVPPIVSSSQANSAEQAIYKATSGQAKSYEMLEGVAFNSADSTITEQTPIETRLVGPDTLGLNDVRKFDLELHNPGTQTEKNLSIQITLPLGLEFSSDEDASQSGARTRTWSLSGLAAKETQTIQYFVKSTSEGSKTQKLWISTKGNAPQARQFDTVVDLQFETEDAPMLPLESDIE